MKAAPPPPAEEVWNRTLSCVLITSCTSANIVLIKTLALASGVAAIPQCANGVVVRFEVLFVLSLGCSAVAAFTEATGCFVEDWLPGESTRQQQIRLVSHFFQADGKECLRDRCRDPE